MKDEHDRVRREALVSLSVLQTPAALEALRDHAASASPRDQPRLVALLKQWGDGELYAFASVDSVEVRRAVAENLRQPRRPSTRRLCKHLLVDEDSTVQSAIVESTKTWSIAYAAPMLLHAVTVSNLQTRQAAMAQLRELTGSNLEFASDWPLRSRVTGVERFAREHRIELLSKTDDPRSASLNDREHRELITELRKLVSGPDVEILDRLKSYPADSVPKIEQFLLAPIGEQGTVLKLSATTLDAIFDELLPAMSPVYSAIHNLKSQDRAVRTAAARRLVQISSALPLSRTAVNRMSTVIRPQQDQNLWRHALQSVMNNETPEAAQLAYAALDQTWPDTRMLACQCLAKHPAPAHANRIFQAELIGYAETSVQIEAIRTAGMCGNPLVLHDGQRSQSNKRRLLGLGSILSSPNIALRIEAAIAMSRLGDGRGVDELIRLSADSDRAAQRLAIQAMGNVTTPIILRNRLIQRLVHIGWSDSRLDVKRHVLASLERMTPLEQQPWSPQLPTPATLDQQMQRWAKWWNERRSPKSLNPS